MKKLFLTVICFVLLSVSGFAQGGVSTEVRHGTALPSGAKIDTIFIKTGDGLYRCNNAPTCTQASHWTKLGDATYASVVENPTDVTINKTVKAPAFETTDTVNNSNGIWTAGTGGDSTCPVPAAGKTIECYRENQKEISVNGGNYAAPSLTGHVHPRSCEITLGNGKDIIPAGTYVASGCKNKFGTLTLTSIECYGDAGSSTVRVQTSAAADLLTGSPATMSCLSTYPAGTLATSHAFSTEQWATVTFTADGTSKFITVTLYGQGTQ